MKLDRSLQLSILTELAEHYPVPVSPAKMGSTDEHVANLAYLTEHGLIDTTFRRHATGIVLNSMVKITASGMDFLADDGGITAIRGVVTIKFHEDTLRQIIELRLEEADLPREEKSRLLEALRELPGESIKHLTTKLLDAGLENLPRAVELIRSVLSVS